MTTNETVTAYAPEHTPRLDMATLAPEVYKAMIRLDAAAGQGVEPKLRELVKIRASQLNHCAFCLDMHTKDALAAHFEEKELAALVAAITVINSWNRFAVTTRMVPGHYRPGQHG